jgi:hypothetical protein
LAKTVNPLAVVEVEEEGLTQLQQEEPVAELL